ncbi:hypothetical protein [Arthrobacter koreensis]|uniref:hypothetical protein n=1 Tax=Arthrobacter koreensis TaxID=199136 RepID=UPI0037FF9A5D
MNIPTPRTAYAVHTDPGDGQTVTESFVTPEERLHRLRQRAQAYFPGRPVPRALGVTDEAEYLAQLLGFFLMINNGRVTLSGPTGSSTKSES